MKKTDTVVDLLGVIVAVTDGAPRVLVVDRDEQIALPHGPFVPADHASLEDGFRQLIEAQAGLDLFYVEQLYTFGNPDRDPRTRVVTVAYVALVDDARLTAADLSANSEVLRVEVDWPGETGGPVRVIDRKTGQESPLAFDHADVLGMAVKRLRGKLDYAPIGFQLLPECFTLLQLQRVHETVMGQATNKDSFRRRMLASGQLEATGERQQDVGHRPAELYRFTRRSAT